MASPGGLSPEFVDKIIEVVEVSRYVEYAGLIAVTVVFFDYFHTLPREIKFMWPSQFSIVKVLYFLLRYFIMVHTLLWVQFHSGTDLSGTRCNGPFNRDAISSQIVVVLCEAISYVRVYAFSGRNRYLTVFLGLCFAAVNVLTYYFIDKFTKTVKFLEFPPEDRLGCLPRSADSSPLTVVGATLIVSLATVTFIMIFIAFHRHTVMFPGQSKNHLLRVFYQDGIFFFICLSGLAGTNIAIFLLAPNNGMHLLIVQPQVCFSAILATRMLLHLREWASKQQIIGSTNHPYSYNPHSTFDATTHINFRDGNVPTFAITSAPEYPLKDFPPVNHRV